MIFVISKVIIGMVLYSKAWRKCDSEDKRGGEAEEYEAPNKFEGRYKSMEAAAIQKMVEYELRDLCFIIDVIVGDNDRKIRAVIKHPSIGYRGQVMKSSKGKLDE